MNLSDEHKRKISIAHIGKKHTKEHVNKMILSLKGKKRKKYDGRLSSFWKHGLSKTKEYRKICNQKYRSLKRNGGELSIKTIQLVYEDNIKKYGTLTCYLCELPIEFGKDNLEHKTPLIRGGNNNYNNLSIACKSCNSIKRHRTEEEYKEIIKQGGK